MNQLFSQISSAIAYRTGRPSAFIVCLLVVFVWLVSGPVFHYSDTWQLVINTATSVLTFLMVFIIQNTQNRDGAAIQAKLDELIRTSSAQNQFIGIEQLTADEIIEYRNHCQTLAKRALERATKQASKKAEEADRPASD
ncbi:MAG TPA: low affinity iron permease family protein [Xanthobacteraceae bacterium]|jgi:low affinity Fe/Cu permease|nr:low affinity iron permease family protein [Xanthobacteraceae bacterium]